MKLEPHNPVKYGFDGGEPPPVPEEHQNDDGRFSESFDSRLWMFHRRWEPPSGEVVRATLMIVHGTVDHSGVYADLGRDLAGAGIAVFAMDMRGWGLSDGESMYVDGGSDGDGNGNKLPMDTFVRDVDALYRQIHSSPRYENVKNRFLLGKSIGGTVTAFCVDRYPQNWTGYLGLSGAYQVDPNLLPSSIVSALLKAAAYVAPKMPLKRLFDEHLIVKNGAALQAWRDDRLCCKDRVRVGYVVTLADSLAELPDAVARVDVPMLMMCGEDDRVVTREGHELMVEKNRNSDKEFKLYPGGFHNLLAEPDLKSQVASDIRGWILARSPPAAT